MNKFELRSGLGVALLAMLVASCGGGGTSKTDAKSDAKDATTSDAKDGSVVDTGTDVVVVADSGTDVNTTDTAVDVNTPDAAVDVPAADVAVDMPAVDVAVDMPAVDVPAADAAVDMTAVDTAAPTFTVSGTVSGLAGAGLVLRNNGGDSLNVAATATTFTFATRIATGGAYAVTVFAQPSAPTQVCTVTSGTGTIATANVVNVAVLCVTQTYTVGVTVTGLTGLGLVVRNTTNAGAATDRAVTANGTFAFPALPSGNTYSVSILTQPSSPTQVCTVGNAAGTITAGNITNVTVACATTAFTVGGTVTGLTGTGLVLRNNATASTDLTVPAGATSFTFAGSVATGGAYAVTVQTQPTGQTCTVGSGGGTVGAANVTSVTVTCIAATYTIGGSITGLTATGLVLDFGAAAGAPVDVTPAANATSYVSAAAAIGTAYTVTIQAQPTGQTCTVANPTGTISAANVANANVTCTTIPTTATVGGSITGLTTAGLVLDFGAAAAAPADVSPAANATSYVSAAAAIGTAYTVTVQTQPTGRTCTVANPTGTIPAGGASNANVTCTANPTTFTIGGTVTGLTAAGLVLDFGGATNAPADVTPAANATSYVSAAVPNTTAYTVTVMTQPTGLTCTVGGAAATGTVNGANVTGINITCTVNSAVFACGDSGPNGNATPFTITCPGAASQVITAIRVASYGTPIMATCGSYAIDPTCHAGAPLSPANSPATLCMGMHTCTITGGDAVWGDPCPGNSKTLAVEVACGP